MNIINDMNIMQWLLCFDKYNHWPILLLIDFDFHIIEFITILNGNSFIIA